MSMDMQDLRLHGDASTTWEALELAPDAEVPPWVMDSALCCPTCGTLDHCDCPPVCDTHGEPAVNGGVSRGFAGGSIYWMEFGCGCFDADDSDDVAAAF